MDPLTILAIGGGLSALGGISNYFGNRAQANAAAKVAKLNAAEAQRAREFMQQQGSIARGDVRNALGGAQDQLNSGYLGAISSLGVGGQDALDALNAGYGGAGAALGRGQMGAMGQLGVGRGDISGAGLAGLSALLGGAGGAEAALQAAQFRNPTASAMYDPGMEYRRQQGESAIMRGAAARGGRLSGRTLQELAALNQGLASQDYGAAFARQNTLDQQRASQLAQLAQLYQTTGAQAGSMAQQQGAALANLAAQGAGYEMQGGLAGMGLAQQGGQDLARTGYATAQDIANARIGRGTAGANLDMQAAQSMANAAMGVGNQYSQLSPSIMQSNALPAQFAGSGWGILGNQLGGMGNLGLLIGLSRMGGG